MKKIWLMGGFGNTLFQILAYNILIKNGDKVMFKTTLTKNNFITKLLKWKIHEAIYLDLINQESIVKNSILSDLFNLLLLSFSKFFRLNLKRIAFYDSKNKFSINCSKNILSYFQYKSFLKDHKKELLDLGKVLRIKYSYFSDNIVVHYRRGDSVWALKHEKYYMDIKELLRLEKSQILIVTDSVEEATNFFIDIKNTKIIKSERAIDDFKHLVSAKKLYCAPSTFSWWAAHSLDVSSEVVIPKILISKLGYYSNKNILKVV